MTVDRDRHTRFISLVEAHQAAIRRIVAVYAIDCADRADLMQEIALQLWRSFETFRGEAAFSTFLYRVALNTALHRKRAASRRPRLEERGLEAVEDIVDVADDERVQRLYAAIRVANPVDRAVLLLMLEGRSYDEIAAVTGLTVSAVGARLTRAKERLASLLRFDSDVPEVRHA